MKMKMSKWFTMALMCATVAIAAEKKAEKAPKAAKAAAAKVDLVSGKKVYDTYCSSCHGATGKGDGVAAHALNPKPRNFLDSAYMKSRTDEILKKVIVEGGAANNLSPLMSPWGGTLKPNEIDDVLGYVRSFLKP
jgi:mono/diheme cytochrome c family protein